MAKRTTDKGSDIPSTIQRSGKKAQVSARYLRQEFTGRVNRHHMTGHLWSPSYFAASCGGAPLAIVKQYIQDQERPD